MIRINQIGYQPSAAKVCILDHPETMEFQVLKCVYRKKVLWEPCFTGTLVRKGSAYLGDFSAIREPADYRILCGKEESTNFVIKPNPYQHLERLLTEFYTWQRCGHAKGWAGICHQDPVPLCGTDRKLDMRGGYHQSGDLRCWHDGCPSALYGYMRFAETGKPVWECGLFDEELKWGVDYFRKTVSPEGFIYDCQFVPIGWGPRDYYNLPAPLSDHYNVCRLLARAALWFRAKDAKYASECLALARKVWDYVEQHPFDVPYEPSVKDLPGGTQKADFYWQNRKGATGMNCSASAAAYDLYNASGDKTFLDRAYQDMRKVLAMQITTGEAAGLFRDSADPSKLAFMDCGYAYQHNKMVYLADLIREQPDAPDAAAWKRALELHCDMVVREFELTDPVCDPLYAAGKGSYFGKHPEAVRPFTDSPVPVWHVPTTSTSYMAVQSYVLAEAAKLLGRKEYLPYAQYFLDYLLGNNPFGASTITGVGYNHLNHNVFGQFFPSTPQMPGGIIHVMPGEYDLPVAGVLLRALTAFRD